MAARECPGCGGVLSPHDSDCVVALRAVRALDAPSLARLVSSIVTWQRHSTGVAGVLDDLAQQGSLFSVTD